MRNQETLGESEKSAVGHWLSPGHSAGSCGESGRKAGWGNFHGQGAGYIAFTLKLIMEHVCWEVEEETGR